MKNGQENKLAALNVLFQMFLCSFNSSKQFYSAHFNKWQYDVFFCA